MITPGVLAPLSVAFFLGTMGLAVLLVAAALWLFRGHRSRARRLALGAIGLVGAYLLALTGVGLASRTEVVPPGVEKYFCELDCHVAYRVKEVRRAAGEGQPGGERWLIVLQTRFDETTISPRRPRDAPVWPAPRRVDLLATDGGRYPPVPGSIEGTAPGHASTPLTRELRPGMFYETILVFDLPADAGPAALDLTDDLLLSPLLIGHERSPWHAAVLLGLPASAISRR